MNSTAPQHYQDTRNGLLQVNQATRLSPWLAWGCLSARQVHRALVEHEERFGATQQTHWIRVELWWRDYFHHRLLIRPKTYFKHMHVSEMPFRNALQEKRFRGWCMGTEGHDFCRAHQKELLHTGYQTNRGRQNTASFLIHNLQLPAVWGALWFQHRLVDFDVASNYGNWAYLAGSGDDPRPNRQFNLDRQQDLYDPQYTYTNRWISA
jgi:deoxyribodipyrimidine photo-lyase